MTTLEMPATMEDLREELAHFGVKGMRWGERHDRKPTPRQQRKMDRNDRIDAARGRVASGQSGRERAEAKSQFKSEKRAAKAKGDRAAKVAAKRKWKIAKEKYNNDVYTAQLTKSGAETAAALLTVAGGAALSVASRQVASRQATSFHTSPSAPRGPIRVQAHVGSPH